MSTKMKPMSHKDIKEDKSAGKALLEVYKITREDIRETLLPSLKGVLSKETISILRESWLVGCTDNEAAHNACITLKTLRSLYETCPEVKEIREILKSNYVYRSRQVMNDLIYDEDKKIAYQAAKFIIEKADGKAVENIDLKGELNTPESVMLAVRKLQEKAQLEKEETEETEDEDE